MAQCGAKSPAAAADCINLLKKCVGPQATPDQQKECVDEFNRLKDQISQGIIFKNADISKLRLLLGGLGIDYTSSGDAISKWLASITLTNPVAASQIATNTDLIGMLQTLIAQAKQPNLVPGSIDQTKAIMSGLNIWRGVPFKEPKADKTLSLSTIPAKKTRLELAAQSGGGIKNSSNSFIRLMDSMESVINMRGGGKELFEELAKTYENFVYNLKSKGKQIDPTDDKHIRDLLVDLKNSEEKLNTLVKYVFNYNKLLSDPRFANELKYNSVTQEILNDLYNRKNEIETKYATKAKNIKSIIETVYQALQGNDSTGNKVGSSQIGPNLNNALRGLNN